MLELDLILTRVLDRHYPGFGDAELIQFEKLLALEDTVLLRYLYEGEEPTDPELKLFIQKIRQ